MTNHNKFIIEGTWEGSPGQTAKVEGIDNYEALVKQLLDTKSSWRRRFYSRSIKRNQTECPGTRSNEGSRQSNELMYKINKDHLKLSISKNWNQHPKHEWDVNREFIICNKNWYELEIRSNMNSKPINQKIKQQNRYQQIDTVQYADAATNSRQNNYYSF